MIKLTKISVHTNKVMLKKFFENTIECGGKVVEVTINSKERSAIVTFDTSAAVYEIMNKRPLRVFGFQIDVEVYNPTECDEKDMDFSQDNGSDTLAEEPNMIILTKLPADMNKVMLKKILANTIECEGKVVEMTVNSKDRFAIVKFDTPAAVYEIMYKRPLEILGFKIDVDVYTGTDERAERGLQGADSLQTTVKSVLKEKKSSESAERIKTNPAVREQIFLLFLLVITLIVYFVTYER